MDKKAVQRIVRELGGPAAVARRLRSKRRPGRCLTIAAVMQWSRIPVDHVHDVCAMSGSKYRPEDLRPDVYLRAA